MRAFVVELSVENIQALRELETNGRQARGLSRGPNEPSRHRLSVSSPSWHIAGGRPRFAVFLRRTARERPSTLPVRRLGSVGKG
jgi:hypothetical protein